MTLLSWFTAQLLIGQSPVAFFPSLETFPSSVLTQFNSRGIRRAQPDSMLNPSTEIGRFWAQEGWEVFLSQTRQSGMDPQNSHKKQCCVVVIQALAKTEGWGDP